MIHQANHRNILREILILGAIAVPLCYLLTVLVGMEMVLFFFCIAIWYLFRTLFIRDIKSIEVDMILQKVVVIKTAPFLAVKKIEFEISRLAYTYKKEALSKSSSGKCLRFYENEERRLRLSRMDSGWDEEKIDKVVTDLDHASIQRKFIGYSLKDVYPE